MAKDRTTIGQMREQIQVVTMTTAPVGVYSGANTFSVKYTLRARVRSMEGYQSKNDIGYTDNERTNIVIIRRSESISIDNDDMIKWDGAFYKILGKEYISRNVDDPKKRFIRFEVVYDSDEDAFTEVAPETIEES